MKPTDRQLDVLAFIERHIAERGYAPTWREIADALGIRSTNAVHDHMEALYRKGFVVWDPRKSRTIRVLKKSGRQIENVQGAGERLFEGPVPEQKSRAGGDT